MLNASDRFQLKGTSHLKTCFANGSKRSKIKLQLEHSVFKCFVADLFICALNDPTRVVRKRAFSKRQTVDAAGMRPVS